VRLLEFIELDADGNDTRELVDTTQDPHADYASQMEREGVRAAIRQLPVEFRETCVSMKSFSVRRLPLFSIARLGP
jgi:hypothetical protein